MSLILCNIRILSLLPSGVNPSHKRRRQRAYLFSSSGHDWGPPQHGILLKARELALRLPEASVG